MAIVYLHRKADIEDTFKSVFYVGIGISEKRAYSKLNRSKYWTNIVKKHNYIIEIVESNITWKEACFKEIELIAFYGRRDLGLGNLCNLTNGGDGGLGMICSETRRKLLHKRFIGKNNPMYGIRLTGEKNHMTGKKHTKESLLKMKKVKLGENNPNYNRIGSKSPDAKKVIQIDKITNQIVNEFGSVRDASDITRINKSCISNCCCKRKGHNYAGGYLWKYI